MVLNLAYAEQKIQEIHIYSGKLHFAAAKPTMDAMFDSGQLRTAKLKGN